MIVLLKDAETHNLCCMEVVLAGYEEAADELWFHGHGDDNAMIPELGPKKANAIIEELYDVGKIDLQCYIAFINEDHI